MANNISEEHVEIDSYPINRKSLLGKELTIGDLHANSLKLIWILIYHNILKISADDFETLKNIYYISVEKLQKKDIDEFVSILKKAEIGEQIPLLRMLGDEFADRGSNDYFTIKILEALNEKKINFEIIFSNHGEEFVSQYEKTDYFKNEISSTIISPAQTKSMAALIKILRIHGFQDERQSVKNFIDNIYKKNLKALSYSIDVEANKINIYSHAPIALYFIKHLAAKFKVPYYDGGIVALARTIDAINDKFKQYADKNELHKFSKNVPDNKDPDYSVKRYPVNAILWNRNYNILNEDVSKKGYDINFVHGHDLQPHTNKNYLSLDNDLGKKKTPFLKGKYTALLSKNLDDIEISFKMPIDEIRNEAIHLKKQGYNKESEVVNDFCNKLLEQFAALQSQHILPDDFTKTCKSLINDVQIYLEKHQNSKKLLGNIALAVLGAGVLYAVALLINKAINGNFLFFQTKINKFVEKIQWLKIPDNIVLADVSVKKNAIQTKDFKSKSVEESLTDKTVAENKDKPENLQRP